MPSNSSNPSGEQHLKKMIFFCEYMKQARSEALERYRIIGEKSINLFYILSGLLAIYGFLLSLLITNALETEIVTEMRTKKVFLYLCVISLVIIVIFLVSAFINIIESLKTSSYEIPQFNNAPAIAKSFSTIELVDLYRQFGEAHETWIQSINEAHTEKSNKISSCISNLYMASIFSIILLTIIVLFFFIK